MKFIDKILDGQSDYGKLAIVASSQSVTYKQLRENVALLASQLNDMDQKDNHVAIFLERSIGSIISILGILRSQNAYVPIDFSLPAERIDYILKNCETKTVITDDKGFDKIKSIVERQNISVILMKTAGCNGSFKMRLKVLNRRYLKGSPPEKKNDRHKAAYIIYTSGSTGRPKGVIIGRDSFSIFVSTIVKHIPYYRAGTMYLSLLPFQFDGSIVDIFPNLVAGGTTVLMEPFVLPNQLLSKIDKYKITFTCLTSTVLKLLVSRFSNMDGFDLTSLEAIWYGTESCPAKTIRELKKHLPRTQFIQGYGPTEATCTTHTFFIDDIDMENTKLSDMAYFPIGKPIPTVNAYAVTDGELITPGQVGELYIGGPQLMQGYCKDDEKTKSVFGTFAGEKVYKTGDYVTIDSEGHYIFIGRKDDMIKKEGKLIYLSEIEAALLSLDNIKDAIVLTGKEDEISTSIISFVKLHESCDLSTIQIKKTLSEKLPEYMIPDEIELIKEDIPRTVSGKLDRKKLINSISKAKILETVDTQNFK